MSNKTPIYVKLNNMISKDQKLFPSMAKVRNNAIELKQIRKMKPSYLLFVCHKISMNNNIHRCNTSNIL